MLVTRSATRLCIFLVLALGARPASADELNLTSGTQPGAQRADFCVTAGEEGPFHLFEVEFEGPSSGWVELDGGVLFRFTDTNEVNTNAYTSPYALGRIMQSPPRLTPGVHRITLQMVKPVRYKNVRFGAQTSLREVSCAGSPSVTSTPSTAPLGGPVGAQDFQALEQRITILESRFGAIEAKLGLTPQPPATRGKSFEERLETTEKALNGILDIIIDIRKKVDEIKSPPKK